MSAAAGRRSDSRLVRSSSPLRPAPVTPTNLPWPDNVCCVLEQVTVSRYAMPLREGGSLSAIVEADNLGTYVLYVRRCRSQRVFASLGRTGAVILVIQGRFDRA